MCYIKYIIKNQTRNYLHGWEGKEKEARLQRMKNEGKSHFIIFPTNRKKETLTLANSFKLLNTLDLKILELLMKG